MFEIVNSKAASEKSLKEAKRSLAAFHQRKDLGFVFLPDRKELWERSHQLGTELRNKFQNLVIVGIGGSSLGARVLAQVQGASNVHFLDNVDAVEYENILKRLGDLKKTAWLFISKSGTTIETLLSLEFLDQQYQSLGLSLAKHSVVVTENKQNTLGDWADRNSVPRAEVPLDVGGRFSVLCPVGLVPAAFMGMDLGRMNKAAEEMRTNTQLIETLMAHTMDSYERGEWITLFWYYSSRAHTMGMWLQQLWAESLGKKINRENKAAPRASTPMWAVGAMDQHSILQQVMEGAKDKFVIFHRFEDAEGGQKVLPKNQFTETETLIGKKMGDLLRAEAMATQEALNANGVSTLCLKSKALDEASLSAYFMLMELVVAGLGEWLNINAFDQPGVELGKRLAKDLLKKA